MNKKVLLFLAQGFVEDKPIVIDKNIITSTGPATGLAVAFHLIEMLTDSKNVDQIKRNMRFKPE